MKTLTPLALVSTILVTACAGFSQDKVDSQAPVAAPSSPTVHNYQCESGETILATYRSTDSARVQYEGSTYNMQTAVSGSGARYVGGGLEWWTKGSGAESEGTLFRHMADGTSGDIIELCKES
ncbi:MAG: MliC family protein [Marinobacter sp.]